MPNEKEDNRAKPSEVSRDLRKRVSIDVPWKRWFGDEKMQLTFPSGWNVKKIEMSDAETISDEEIRRCIAIPRASPSLRDLARGKKRPAIVIDDLNRPTETHRILPVLLDELEDAGIRTEEIDVLVSLGAHRPMSRSELVKKIGEKMVDTLKVYNHSPYENLTLVGKTSFGTPLHLNRTLVEADLKIIVGSVIPHPYAGFGGGAKLVLPGLAGMDTIELNHKPAYASMSGTIGRVEGNQRRAEIEEAAEMVGIDFAVNSICNSEGRTAGIFAGGLAESYREAVRYAQKVYATEVPYNLDVAVFNAFPKDEGVIQSFNSLNVWSSRSGDRQIVKQGGTVVIASSCPEGVGYHGLTDKGMRLYVRRDKHGSFKDIINGRRIIFFSPNLIPRDIHDFLPETTLLCRQWREVEEELKRTARQDASAGVFPCGPLQIDRNILT
ncbi:MAG: nickel-dependent lactate racemase [Thaumarchaeota archaeon]|nr:nickel-dependent lactate racemase [Nitrososphaerota archaeon]MCL5317310.1 nickel-dependent lactate racemase [Nitrososphaerota archaeon]